MQDKPPSILWKDEMIERFCRETVADMSLPDDADSRWRWVGPLYATGYWSQGEIIDLFPTSGMKDQRHLERQVEWCCKRTSHDSGSEWLLKRLGDEGFSFQEFVRRECAEER